MGKATGLLYNKIHTGYLCAVLDFKLGEEYIFIMYWLTFTLLETKLIMNSFTISNPCCSESWHKNKYVIFFFLVSYHISNVHVGSIRYQGIID